MEENNFCKCCGKILKNSGIVWMEMSWATGLLYKKGSVPDEYSQGCFPVGKYCSKKINNTWEDEELWKNNLSDAPIV